MSDDEVKQNPDIVNVPMAISAQTVNYNLPGLNTPNLRLDGPTLAGIYAGKIRQWDDAGDRRPQSGREPCRTRTSSRSVAPKPRATRSSSRNI